MIKKLTLVSRILLVIQILFCIGSFANVIDWITASVVILALAVTQACLTAIGNKNSYAIRMEEMNNLKLKQYALNMYQNNAMTGEEYNKAIKLVDCGKIDEVKEMLGLRKDFGTC